MKDRLHVAMLLARHAGRAARRRAAAPRRAARRWWARRGGERLLIAPQTLRTVDPTVAAEIGAGYFAFGGRIVHAVGRSPFAPDPLGGGGAGQGGDAWMRQLAGFGWLRHLRSSDDPALRGRGREVVGDFLASGRRLAPAWEAATVARRLLSFLSQSPIVLAGADRAFYARFIAALDDHAAELESRLAAGLAGTDRLLAALALAEYGLCIETGAARQRRSSDALAAALAAQVLPDGGHISRDPQVLIDVLLDLLPLRQAYAARSVPPPLPLIHAIDRMIPMLRLLRHGDGTLALFNGMGRTASDLVATILTYDDGRAAAPLAARHAGYQRMEGGATVVIVDAGAPPPQPFSTRAHAGALAFEMSSGTQRLVINCGGGEGGRADLVRAARATAAHSTLAIADTSSCRFAAATGVERYLEGAVIAGPTAVVAERDHADGTTALLLAHDGYGARFGLVHRRTLRLADDGSRLDGHDRLEQAEGAREAAASPVAVRFHLHPAVKARLQGGDDPLASAPAVRLDLPDGAAWLFETDHPRVSMEPSVLFAAAGGPRATTQIVIGGDAPGFAARWSFRLLASAPRPAPR